MRETCASVSYSIPLHRLPLADAHVSALAAALAPACTLGWTIGLLPGVEVANQRLANSRYARSSRLASRAPRSGILGSYFALGTLSLGIFGRRPA